MKTKIIKTLKLKGEVLAITVTEEALKKGLKYLPKTLYKDLSLILKIAQFKAKEGEVFDTYLKIEKVDTRIILVGLGAEKDLQPNSYRNAGGVLGKIIKKGTKKVIIDVTSIKSSNVINLYEGFLYAQYKFTEFKTDKEIKSEKGVEVLNLFSENHNNGLSAKLKNAEIIVNGAELVRTLVDNPSNVMDGNELAKVAKTLAKDNKYKVEIIKEKDLIKQKWGALLAVNQGSSKEAKCIVLRYFGASSKTDAPTVLVGKGVTFDTGGYNIKPTGYMEDMHHDMGGAATVMGVFAAIAELGIKKNIVGIMPIAENMVSSTAYKPSDIITSLSGKTIHVTNTDAEGRLILADAITYATKQKPKEIISIATLTGAVIAALGDRYSGVMGNKKEMCTGLIHAGEKTDDLCWELPVHKDFIKSVKSEIADLHNYNMSNGRLAGTAKAAAFLQEFVDNNDWCHMDIAGTCTLTDPKPYQQKGAVAGGYRALIEYLIG